MEGGAGLTGRGWDALEQLPAGPFQREYQKGRRLIGFESRPPPLFKGATAARSSRTAVRLLSPYWGEIQPNCGPASLALLGRDGHDVVAAEDDRAEPTRLHGRWLGRAGLVEGLPLLALLENEVHVLVE